MSVTLVQLATQQATVDTERHAMLARRLQSWLANEPAPADIIDAFYQVTRRLEEAVPGGLTTTSAHIPLRAFCQCLLYCDLDDFLAIWPHIRSTHEPVS